MTNRTWSIASKAVWDTLDYKLQILTCRIRDEVCDISLTSGYRGKEEQDNAFARKVSKLKWPLSKHNTRPSLAVDLQPYPYPEDKSVLWAALGYIAGRAHGIAYQEGFEIRWGGDWDGDGDLTDQNFYDLFHIEVDGG